MKINDLVQKFKDKECKEQKLMILLNEIANYVMFEQAIVKKDNNTKGSSIKYRYDEKSYKYINDFFENIEFLSKPVIGSAKKVIIKDLPNEYKNENKHEISFSDKIYLLDKIKDSFMHLNGDDTLYDFDFNDKVVVIKNKTPLYSLECKIPFFDLYRFNKYIKIEYDNSSPSLEWIEKKFERIKKMSPYINRKLIINNKDIDLRVVSLQSGRKVIYIPGTNFYYFREKAFLDEDVSDTGITKKEYDFYYINSYLSLLMASMDEMNYPLLDDIYDFDFHCQHTAYVSKMSAIMKKITDFYYSVYSNIDNLNHDILKKKIIDFIYHINQNGKENGLLVDISDINNMIIKKYMRNARSHANNKGVADTSIGNETIIYHDVLYNSLQNEISDKTVPSFVLIGKRKQFDSFFNKLTESSLSNHGLYKKIVDDLDLGNSDTFELFLQQLSKFIEQASKDRIDYSEYLKTPIGNADNFVDFIRKTMNGDFEYEEGKGIKKVI